MDDEKLVDSKPTPEADKPDGRATPMPDKEKPPKPNQVPFFKLFSRSNRCQKAIVCFGIISAAIAGAFAPTIAIIFGEVVAIFDPTNDEEAI